MKKSLIGFLCIFILFFSGVAIADDDLEKKDFDKAMSQIFDKLDQIHKGECPPIPEPVICPEPVARFIMSIDDLPTGAALTVYRVYAGTDGKLFYIPTWAIEPTPQPPGDIDPPEPEWKPNASNAVDKCKNCHTSSDDKFKFVNWKNEDHEKHEKVSCTACHSKI